MRTLFLFLALMAPLLTGCGSDLRTHPVVRSTSAIPKLTAPPEDPIVTTGRELSHASFSQSAPGSLTWRKGTSHGGIIVTLSQGSDVKATAQYNRADGKATCEISGPRVTLVSRIESLDTVPTASKLIADHDCTPA